MNTKVDGDGRDAFVLTGHPFCLILDLFAHLTEVSILLAFLVQELGVL